MRNKYDFDQTEQKRGFDKECKVIDLRYEYIGYVGEERFAIISKLSEADLWEKYPEIIRGLVPFVLMSVAQGQVIEEFYRNEDKYKKRQKKNEDIYGYEDGVSEIFHPELITEDYLKGIEQYETQVEERELLKQAMEALTPTQRRRVIKRCVQQKSLVAIAMEEGVNHSKVDNSVKAGIKKMRRCFGCGENADGVK